MFTYRTRKCGDSPSALPQGTRYQQTFSPTSSVISARRINVPFIASSLLACSLSANLTADVAIANYHNDQHFNYHILHMPDFDQIRDGLPVGPDGYEGEMYCVPASCANILAYMSTHGYPDVGPEYADWEAEENYDDITRFIENLGTCMHTDASDGTILGDAATTMVNRISRPTGGRFTVEYEYTTATNVVTLKELARSAIYKHALQTVNYGRYVCIGQADDGAEVLERDGGHTMTLAGLERSGSTRHLWAMNPGDSSDPDGQSDFGADDWTVYWEEDLKIADSVDAANWMPSQGMNRLDLGDPDYLALIDKRIVVRPVGVTTWGAWSGESVGISTLAWMTEESSFGLSSQSESAFTPRRMLQSPAGISFAVQRDVDGLVSLWVERPTDEVQSMAPVELGPLPDGVGAIDVVFSKDRQLLALCTDGTLRGFPGFDNGTEHFDSPSVNPVLYNRVDSGHLGWDVLAHDDQLGTTAILDIEERRLLLIDRYFEDLREIAVPITIPLELIGENGILEFKIDALGNAYFAQRGGAAIHMMSLGETQDVLLDLVNLQEMRGFDFDQAGNILVNDAGTIRCFSFTPEGLVETGTEGSAFAGQQVGYGLVIDRGTSNYDPRIHESAGWTTDLLDCVGDDCATIAADLDGNNQVNGADLAILLGAWGNTNVPADLDGDGSVGGGDMAILLGAFGS